jgi:cystathionine gamma-synthase
VSLRRETRLVHEGRPTEGPLSPPVVLASNFRDYGYAREEGSPTWEAFEAAVGALEGGAAVAFASGMGAISAVLEPLPVGARVVGPAVGYTVTRGLLGERAAAGRIALESVDLVDTEAVLRACEGAALLWVETPTNPLVGIAELDRLCEGAHAAGAEVVVDATFATPLLQRPLELGADVVVHSATKFIGGHSDLLLGVASAAAPERAEALRHARGTLGATPGALEAFLALRGLRTLAVRLERAQATAALLAERLAAHPAVTVVHYPGLPDDPGHERAAQLMDGFGAMLAFEVEGGADAAQAVCDRVQVVVHATSLGGVETLIERRARYAAEVAPESLLRLSVGIEHAEDLWADLERALGSESR